jgi:transposase-like protein
MIFVPWGEKTLEQLREQFVKEVLSGELPKSKVCEKYGISPRQTHE